MPAGVSSCMLGGEGSIGDDNEKSLSLVIFASLALLASPPVSSAKPLSDKEARQIAKEAYIYGVPMVTVYSTLYEFSVDKGNPQYKGPFNSILNVARVFTPEDTAFVTPNSDTPYTFIGPDLRAEPMVLTVPAMEKNRYFVFQMMDLYTFNFDYVGSRTTGNNGGDFLIAGPNWKGPVPKGIAKVIRSETQLVNVVGRTQLFNPGDLDNVKKIQAGYKLRPLSDYLGAFGYSVMRGGPRMTTADSGSAAMVCADADRLDKLPPGERSGRIPIVVAVTRFVLPLITDTVLPERLAT